MCVSFKEKKGEPSAFLLAALAGCFLLHPSGREAGPSVSCSCVPSLLGGGGEAQLQHLPGQLLCPPAAGAGLHDLWPQRCAWRPSLLLPGSW